MEVQEYLPHYTLKDFKNWEGKWELITGIPYACESSLPSYHQCTLQNILLNLPKEFETNSNQHTTFQFNWIVGQDTIVCPDIVFVNKPIKTDDFFMSPPLLVMEIITEVSEEKDRGVKFNLYEYEGVQYYILVDPQKEIFEIYELENRFYKLKNKFSSGLFEFNLAGVKADVAFNKAWFTDNMSKMRVLSKKKHSA